MTKCDFCTKSSYKGKCLCNCQIERENACKKAIEKMTEALKHKST